MFLNAVWWRLFLLVAGSAGIAFLVALLIVMSQNAHPGAHALFVYGP